MLTHAFMRHALLAGLPIALACGLTGYFVVLRREVFAGDALSHVAFAGAIGAAALGLDQRIGLLGATVAVALALASMGPRARADDVAIATVFAWTLGLGVLFLSVYNSGGGGANGLVAANALFGSILGLSAEQACLGAAVALAVVGLLLAAGRPLMFCSLDPGGAAAAGLPVRQLGAGFLVALAVVASEGTEAVGALPLLGLIAGPAGTAHRVCGSPYRGLALSGALAVGATCGGLALSYAVPQLPPSTAVVALAVLPFLGVLGVQARAWGPRSGSVAAPGARHTRTNT